MKLSVGMITYNHKNYIARALDGVFAQKTAFDFEVVIGDDCSRDSTREIILEYQRRYPNRVRPVFNEKNLGMIRNFARTIEACRGRYIALLEGDDFWTSPLKLRTQADFLDSHPECSACYHNVNVLDEGRPEGTTLFFQEIPKPFLTVEDLAVVNTIPTCSVVFRAGLFGDFPEWFYSMPMGDWPLNVLNALHGPIGYVDGVFATYRKHSGGAWSILQRAEVLKRTILAARTMNAGIGFADVGAGKIMRRQIGSWQYDLARLYYDQGDYPAAASAAGECFGTLKIHERHFRKALRLYLKSKVKGLAGKAG